LIGTAHAAITILNATATGHGCSLAVKGGITVEWLEGATELHGAPDAKLVDAVSKLTGKTGHITISTTFPHARGLKTSSSAAAALLRAADHPEEGLIESAVAVCRAAGVTLTGAFDDQCAVTLGGCHLTDNGRNKILKSFHVPNWHIAIWIPENNIPKSALVGLDASVLAEPLERAEGLLREGKIPEALTANGAAFLPFYQAAGLDLNPAPVTVAMDAGALGAGLSGTGPAIAAIFEAKTPLAPVHGGTWHWTVTV
jgi:shikimate kinase